MSRHSIILLAAILAAAACARPYETRAAEPAVVERIYINALNENFYDARIYAAYTGGQRRSLGTIAGNGGRASTALAWEPHALVFEVAFVISGATYVSQPITVTRGEHVELRVPANIDQSGFFRRADDRVPAP